MEFSKQMVIDDIIDDVEFMQNTVGKPVVSYGIILSFDDGNGGVTNAYKAVAYSDGEQVEHGLPELLRMITLDAQTYQGVAE